MKRAGLLSVALLGAGLCLSGQAGGAVLGVDVSRFEQEIGWSRVAADGIRFAYVQASRGGGGDCTVKPQTCGPDGFYEFNYRRAREEGIRVGAYHRAFTGGSSLRGARRDARKEAEVFIRSVGSLRHGDLLPALDFETPFAGMEAGELRAWVKAWVRRVRGALGATPMIYTNVSSWGQTGDTRLFARAGHPLWVANWDVPAPALPARRWDGRGWSVWQFSNAGHVSGIDGRVDMDRLGTPFRRVSVRTPPVPRTARRR